MEELPNRNCFGINSVILTCVMGNLSRHNLSYRFGFAHNQVALQLHHYGLSERSHEPLPPNTDIDLAEASFFLPVVLLVYMAKTAMFGHFEAKKKKKKKHDPNWSCFLAETCTFPEEFEAICCLKGRQKTRPWP